MNKPLAIIAAALFLSGCASGIKMTDAEAAACRATECSVWTATELRALVEGVFRQGFSHGARMAGKGI